MKRSSSIQFIFENPNAPSAFEEMLKMILVEKLLAEFAYTEEFP